MENFQKIIKELENDHTLENYTTIMQRIGPFNETMQIKIHTNEEILNELTVCFICSFLRIKKKISNLVALSNFML